MSTAPAFKFFKLVCHVRLTAFYQWTMTITMVAAPTIMPIEVMITLNLFCVILIPDQSQ